MYPPKKSLATTYYIKASHFILRKFVIISLIISPHPLHIPHQQPAVNHQATTSYKCKYLITCICFIPILVIINDIFICFLSDFDMKKDIDTLIAEERAEIISKYDRVSVCTGIPSPNFDSDITG